MLDRIKKLLPQSLMRRLELYYTVAFVVILGLTFALLYWSIGAVLEQRMDSELTEDITQFSRILQSDGVDALISKIDDESSGKESESMFLFLYDSKGTLLHNSRLAHWESYRPDPAQVQLASGQPGLSVFKQMSLPQKEEDIRVIYSTLTRDYVLVIGELLEEREELMDVLFVAFISAFVLALPLVALLIWFLTHRAVAGIRQVSDVALAIKGGDLHQRVGAANQVTEVQVLADTFDAMADRIQTLISNMRDMTDNIAHDLRSPLGRIRLLSESVLHEHSSDKSYRDVAEDTVRECDRLIRMINVSLDVAESEAGVARMNKVQTDIGAMTADVCDMFDAVAEQKGIRFVYPDIESRYVIGDITSLQRMLANIIDNAIKYTLENGYISVTTIDDKDRHYIRIEDSGIGINESDFDNIFNRFFRIDPSRSRSGCGLGLSYSRAVARAHGGDIIVESEIGKSSVFIVSLPADEIKELTSPELLKSV